MASPPLLAERFRLAERIGEGGMGHVHRGEDLQTGEPVAVKLLAGGTASDAHRFIAEAATLARLDHPSIVRHVGHGVDPVAGHFLAMQWVDGQDLSRRLARGPLARTEALAVAADVASALASAHAAGVVHRDVKPSNVMLRAKDGRACLVDFGIARAFERTTRVTATGVWVGTPSYMSPEQAAGTAAVGPPTDVFALGCLLVEALSGMVAFPGDSVPAVLTRILFAAPTALPPDIRSDGLDTLLARMFEKDPERRPTAREAEAALRRLGQEESTSRTNVVGQGELRIATLWFAHGAATGLSPTIAVGDSESDGTRAVSTRGYGADVFSLADGTLVGRVGAVSARDQARAVVQSALKLKAARPDLWVVVTTGRATTQGLLPEDDAVDRAARMLSQAACGPSEDGVVRVDAATADLVDGEATVAHDDRGAFVRGATPAHPARARASLVGRAKELLFLEGLASEARDESVLRAVVVVANPGLGKSRLADELVSRIDEGWTLLAARCDPLEATVPLSGIMALLRSSRHSSAPGALLREPLYPVAAGDEPVLQPAVAAACASLVRLAREGALLLLVEDLQWLDGASAEVLRRLGTTGQELPIAVMAFTRPEGRDRHAALLAALGTIELPLGPLPRRSSETLVRSLLEPSASEEVVASLVDRGAGHPMFLEELARSYRETGLSHPHASLAAVLESRLCELPTAERRLLRAASVFGLRFSARGAAHLLAGTMDIDAMLARLLREGLIVRSPAQQEGEAADLVFAHALVRDAAYAMLPETDRHAAHAFVARWLEASGEVDLGILAEHWLRGATTAEEVARATELACALADATALHDALQWLDRADGLVRTLADTRDTRRARLSTLSVRTRISMRGQRARVRPMLTEWKSLATELGDVAQMAAALSQEAALLAGEEQWELAASIAEQVRVLARASGVPQIEHQVHRTLTILAFDRGELETALSESVATARSGVTRRARASALHNAGDAALRLGDYPRALQLLDESDEEGFRDLLGPYNDALRTFVRAMQDPTFEFRQALAAQIAIVRDRGETWSELEMRILAAVLEAWRGDRQLAASSLEELQSATSRMGYVGQSAEVAAMRAALAKGGRPWWRGGRPPVDPSET